MLDLEEIKKYEIYLDIEDRHLNVFYFSFAWLFLKKDSFVWDALFFFFYDYLHWAFKPTFWMDWLHIILANWI